MGAAVELGRLAFIGAGQMGMPMVRRLVGAGRVVTVYARRQEVRAECAGLGAGATPDIAEAVGDADAVVVCLYSDAQLRELALGANGFLGAMKDDALVLIHTTGSPATAPVLASHGADRNLRSSRRPSAAPPRRSPPGA